MAELRRAAIRITSNYVRLVTSMVLGIYLVRVFLTTVGEEGYGLYALLGSTVGIVGMIEEAASWSMIRELGSAHHASVAGDQAAFLRMYNSAVALCILTSGLIVIAFAGIYAALPWMDISTTLLPYARWFVIAKAIETVILVLFSPQYNMYLITERMVAYNFWYTMRRVAGFASAIALFWLNPPGADGIHNAGRGLMIYGWLSMSLMIVTIVASTLIITLQDRRLVPALGNATRSGMRALIGISGWNIGIQASQNFGFPAGAIIMNKAFGLVANATYGYTTALAGYVRQVASGMTWGLDAVATRMTTGGGGDIRHLLRYSTMLHGVSAFPTIVVLAVLAEPILHIWIGSKVTDPLWLSNAPTMLRILLVAYGIIVLCDCWTRILFGAGYVARYAPIVIVGNICTPVVAIVYLFAFPTSHKFTAAVAAISTIYAVVYLGFIPPKTAKAFGVSYWDVMQPLIRPLIAALICTPIPWLFLRHVPHWNLLWLAEAGLSYGMAYAAAVWWIVLGSAERARLAGIVRSRLLVKRPA